MSTVCGHLSSSARYRHPANSGHSITTFSFLHSGRWSDLRGTGGMASEPHRDSAWKLQLTHNSLKARLLAQGVQERIGLEVHQTRVPQPQRRLEPFERLRQIAPLRIDRGVLVRIGIALCRL